LNFRNSCQKLSPEARTKILALSRIYGVGPRIFIKLINSFQTIDKVFNASIKDLSDCIPDYIARRIRSDSVFQNAKDYLALLQEENIKFTTVLDEDYPKLLREIYDPPIVLYYNGDYKKEDFNKCFAVVGTRNSTRYGEEATKELVEGLVKAGFVIVSGMAFGIDKLSHDTACKNGGRTIAVLSGKVNESSPKSNFKTFQNILENGCVLSECHPDKEIVPGMFPVRNRIISGLSQGILVIEAGKKSGALITAYQALEQGREIFAVPSDIYSEKGVGTNSLIKRGNAKLVQGVEDILEEFGIRIESSEMAVKHYSKEEQMIIDFILKGGATMDEIVAGLDMDIAKVAQILTMMEIEKKVAKDEGSEYFIVK
jgi:DNA processing protein